ncbi:HAD family phosphatase [Acetobacterium sp. K1/6]|uniref:HAD family hydrolase n=1 Tax=Acetobacterium sp. K1/6 TaxID=3055467 RepID=UPI002ACA2FCC|nr:HAD family phosphatase [Acetobacterium sp. K1/6]MDZ5724138.1 HAD family phosphatase [Acetobacterium sp. K1/6]
MNQAITNVEGMIFDLDGTLIDSMPAWENIGSDFLKKHGIAPPDDLNETIKTMSFAESARYFIEFYGVAMTEEQVGDEINGMIRENYARHIALKPFVKEALDQYLKQGIKMGILTATHKTLTELVLRRFGLQNHFEFILTSGMTGLPKSQPEIYHQAVAQLQLPAQRITIFEDSLYCIKAARETGCHIIGVFDEASKEDWEAIKRSSDSVIMSFKELLR